MKPSGYPPLVSAYDVRETLKRIQPATLGELRRALGIGDMQKGSRAKLSQIVNIDIRRGDMRRDEDDRLSVVEKYRPPSPEERVKAVISSEPGTIRELSDRAGVWPSATIAICRRIGAVKGPDGIWRLPD